MLFSRSHLANSLPTFESLSKFHFSPYLICNRSSPLIGNFNLPLSCSVFFSFLQHLSRSLMCHIIYLFCLFFIVCLPYLKVNPVRDRCLSVLSAMYSKALELYLARYTGFVNKHWWVNDLFLNWQFGLGHPFWECSLNSKTFSTISWVKLCSILAVHSFFISLIWKCNVVHIKACHCFSKD